MNRIVVFLCLCLSSNLFAQSLPSYVPANGLAAWYPLANGNGNDISGNGLTADYSGFSPTSTTGRQGAADQAVRLDNNSSTQYFTIADDPTLSFTQAFTVATWIDPDNASNNQKVISKVSNSLSSGFILAINNNSAYVETWDASGHHYEQTVGDVPSNAWTHVAMTCEAGGSLIVYVNGSETGRIAVQHGTFATNTHDMMIGVASWDKYSFGYTGAIQETGLWNRALTESEIADLASGNGGPPPPPPPPSTNVPSYIPKSGLLAWYPFNDNAHDESGNGNDGTVHGATISMDRNLNLSSAYHFFSSNYIEATVKNLPTGNSPRSLSVWVNATTFPGDYYTIVNYGSIANNQRCGLTIDPNGDAFVVAEGNDLNPSGSQSDVNAVGLSWHHLLFSFDGTTAKFYFDNKLVATGAKTYSTASTNLFIGWNGDNAHNGGEYYWGDMDNLAVWNRALTPSEVASVYGEVAAVPWQSPHQASAVFYPNPARRSATLVTEARGAYEIIDALGRTRTTGLTVGAATTLSLTGLAPGRYLLRTSDGASQPFVVVGE